MLSNQEGPVTRPTFTYNLNQVCIGSPPPPPLPLIITSRNTWHFQTLPYIFTVNGDIRERREHDFLKKAYVISNK